MFETFALQSVLDYPVFILKKELLKIPLFGLYLKKIKSIEIVRDTTTKDNLNFFDKVANIIKNEKRPLLIFPQGTRVKVDDKVPFKKGVARIYEALNISCVPIALNSGKVWPKHGIVKHPGKITVSFLKPIEPGLGRDEFIRNLSELSQIGPTNSTFPLNLFFLLTNGIIWCLASYKAGLIKLFIPASRMTKFLF